MTRRRRLGDIEVAWREEGVGPPLVLLHGLAEDRRSWSAQQAALLDRRTYAYDLRGHGETSLGDADGTLEQLADDLLRFLADVSGPAPCVGFSLGGTVVLAAAAQGGDLVTRAVVLGASSVVGRSAAAFYGERIALASTGIGDSFREALRADTAAGLAVRDVAEDGIVERRLAAVGTGEGYVNAARAMERLAAEPLTEALQRIAVPVDVVGAENDAFCPRKAADLIMAGVPHAAYHELPAAGHLMNVDDPAAVTALLRDLLTKENP